MVHDYILLRESREQMLVVSKLSRIQVRSMEASWSCDATELRLGLPGNQAVDEPSHKRAFTEDNNNNESKVQIVGWPPVRSHRIKAVQKRKPAKEEEEEDISSEHVITYEDKDGDWMMVGDVPWEMFISICKRVRIMKGSEARGLGSSL
ncbi:uncharacterized protein A4U43_C01F11540 [Asparagus officinalis]|uniref:Auxin-responsive protein n=1 Tax=Asparagus officinalis TaxID=4686 RepID=A0A5P1FSC7_ASPOF|nr:uncharacterized protein A4U43_C01F11540 [Asparagus officinalis]